MSERICEQTEASITFFLWEMRDTLRRILFVIILTVATFIFQRSIPPIYHHSEPLDLLPSGPLVAVITAPLGPLTPDLIWLTAIQYYGEEKLTGGSFQFLFDVFDVLTRIDPHFEHAYQFGSIVIAEEGRDPSRAIMILKRGLIKNPLSWIPPFYIGFINYLHKHDYQKAGRYFEWTSRYHDAPECASRLAALAYKKGRALDASIFIWTRIYETTENKNLKDVALRNVKYLIVEKHLKQLNAGLHRFEDDKRRKPNSLTELIPDFVEKIPEEPFGGRYLYDTSGDSVESSSYLELMRNVSLLNERLGLFYRRFGYYPERLDELVAKGLIKYIPPHPLGRIYHYQKGKVDG